MAISPKIILTCFLGVNTLSIFYILLTSRRSLSPNPISLKAEIYDPYLESIDLEQVEVSTIPPYTFIDSSLAHKVLKQLDIFDMSKDAKLVIMQPERYRSHINLKNNDNYCIRHRELFAENPSLIFEKMNFIFDVTPNVLMRGQAAPSFGFDVQPDVGPYDQAKNETLVELDLNANMFLTRREIHSSHQLGQHFNCLTQSYNHIPSDGLLGTKNKLAEAISSYGKKYEGRPQCFSYDKFFPETWLLYDEESCRDFFRAFNSPEYFRMKQERRIVYIRKIGQGAHMGSGVQPVNDEEEAALRLEYGNGEYCGTVKKNYIMQHYIHNPLLVNGHKFDFRLYLLIASSNPFIAYYHDGFLRVSLSQYDINSDDKKVLLTNLALSEAIYEDVKKGNLYDGMNAEELKHAQQWSFDRFQAYLLEKQVITDPNWLDNYLRPELKKAFTHLVRLSVQSFVEGSPYFQLFGVDFMLDSDLKVWFIESNSAPGLGGYSKEMEKIIVRMLRDHIEIAMGLLRSRVKRIIIYVNKLIESGLAWKEEGEAVVYGIEKRRREFQMANKNFFEEEFEPSPGNGFSKIIDENLEGVERYQRYIEEECL